tara:strand:- start:107 stop:631 length:525 start_codon:yes stop_codon:yes gene_type:complete
MFYYRLGNIVTYVPWCIPSIEAFDKWLNEWSKTPGLNKYNVYLTGAFCQNYFFNKTIDTDDIDVTLEVKQGVSINYYELRHILEQGIKIGFQKNLLIDIFVVEDAFKFTDRKILNYTEIEKKSDTESFQLELIGNITELIPGLYEKIDDCKNELNKYLEKNYEVLSKKLVLPNN